MKLRNTIALKSLLIRLKAQEHIKLAPFSTLKVGGIARYLVTPTTTKDLASLQRACKEHAVDMHILSGGSNTLFSDEGFSGVVIRLGHSFNFLRPVSEGKLLVGAATSFAKLTKLAISMGFGPSAGWSGVPGLVGGAVRMNAGTRAGEIKDAIASVRGVLDGEEVAFDRKDITFSYRHTSLPKNLIISEALLALDQQLGDPKELLKSVEDYRRKRRLTQPTTNSLGSFFRNPYPAIAAQLIEKCNLKGLKYKSAQISPLHANFIVNNGGALANDILHIANLAQRAVFDKFGIALLPEVRMVGVFEHSLFQAETKFNTLPDDNMEQI